VAICCACRAERIVEGGLGERVAGRSYVRVYATEAWALRLVGYKTGHNQVVVAIWCVDSFKRRKKGALGAVVRCQKTYQSLFAFVYLRS
jgi:hypothetical protein